MISITILVVFALSCITDGANVVYNRPYATLYYQPLSEAYSTVNSQEKLSEAQLFLPLKVEPYSPPNLYTTPSIADPAESSTVRSDTAADQPRSISNRTQTDSDKFNVNTSEKGTSEKLIQDSELNDSDEQGIYYIYHPDGKLQKIAYKTKDDVRNMAYSAQINYETVQPIQGPIYYYDPKTLSLQQIQL